MSLEIQVDVNLAKMLKLMSFAFKNDTTFWLELLQNSRRSGATDIQVFQDIDYVSISDNGHGVKNFSTLLSKSRSEWEIENVQKESPFGMGFLACLYAAQKIKVHSGKQAFTANTDDLIQLKPVSVEESGESVQGTRIELWGVTSTDFPVEYVAGFPINITTNGNAIARPHTIECGEWIELSFGHVKQLCLQDICESILCEVYYLGVLIYKEENFFSHPVSVIHLDPTAFEACWPDRTTLRNQEAVLRSIRQELKNYYTLELDRYFQMFKERNPLILCDCFEVYRAYNVHYLFNQLDMLPASICQIVSGYPSSARYRQDRDFMLNRSGTITKTLLESSILRFYQCSTYIDLDDEELTGFNNLMFLYYQQDNAWLVDTERLDKNHWLLPYVRDLDKDPVQVTVKQQTVLNSVFPDKRYAAIVCDHYVLSAGNNSVEVRSPALLQLDDDEGLTAVLPQGEQDWHGFTSQVSKVFDIFGHVNQDEYLAKVKEYSQWWLLHSEDKPEDVLQALLPKVLPQQLWDSMISLRVYSSGEYDVIDVDHSYEE